YNRPPFGVKSASGIFQQITDTMSAEIKGAVAYLDDVIIVCRTEEEHQQWRCVSIKWTVWIYLLQLNTRVLHSDRQ
uniref:Reverse transcriptase domain-containing protein n=1 Tax=Parascaris univalens TaxID=6257 RepID=A0A914ZXC8_PARUN